MIMPRIDLQALWRKLSPADMAIVRRITSNWRLRTTRPMLRDSDESRHAAFVWRMVAFMVSPNSQHHCMPTTCFFWLPEGTTKSTMQRLNRLVDEITDTIDIWWGLSWAGLTADQADLRKSCLQGFKNNVPKYLQDSANRKARLADAANSRKDEAERDCSSDPGAPEIGCPF